jgi:serine/threonine protein kinase
MLESTHPDFPSVPELGAWLPQFEVTEHFHAGEDGAWYLGRQPSLDRKVQIEVIPEPDETLAEPLLDRLRRRARLVQPGITAVYDFGRLPSGAYFLVGEYVEAASLDTMITQRQLKLKTAFPLALQICEALQIVHDLPMPHGALNTQTVLVTSEGQAKLTGIGMVQTETGELSWLKPFRGSFTGDIRALGDTLHWMFAKSAPDIDGRLSRDLPPAIATVLRGCLEPGSGRGYTRPEDVATALKDALRDIADPAGRSRSVMGQGRIGEPISSPPPPMPGSTAQPEKLRPVARQQDKPSLMQQMDAFVWKAFRTGLHVLIFLTGITSLIVLLFFKDRIVFEDDTPVPPKTQKVLAATKETDPPAAKPPGLPGAKSLPSKVAQEESVTKKAPKSEPQADPMADLRAQYVSAVQSAANQALENVRLDDLPYLKSELLLLQSGGDIPAVDEPELPASLKVLRQRYREVKAARSAQQP